MEAIGPILIVLAIPLIFRWFPPNGVIGFRVRATMRDQALWYDVNAMFGRSILALGVAMVLLEFVLPKTARVPVLATVGWIGLGASIIRAWRSARSADRQARERKLLQAK